MEFYYFSATFRVIPLLLTLFCHFLTFDPSQPYGPEAGNDTLETPFNTFLPEWSESLIKLVLEIPEQLGLN